jgi:hypothetical protein
MCDYSLEHLASRPARVGSPPIRRCRSMHHADVRGWPAHALAFDAQDQSDENELGYH